MITARTVTVTGAALFFSNAAVEFRIESGVQGRRDLSAAPAAIMEARRTAGDLRF